MKRMICITIIAILIILCSGCEQSPTHSSESAVFYYMQNDFEYDTQSGVIMPVSVVPESGSTDYRSLLEIYLNGPTNYDCISPFPAGIYLESFHMDNNKVQLVLSPHMATLSDSAFTVACACLTRTVIEMTGVKALYISVNGKQINGSDSLMLTLDDFSYYDNIDAKTGH